MPAYWVSGDNVYFQDGSVIDGIGGISYDMGFVAPGMVCLKGAMRYAQLAEQAYNEIGIVARVVAGRDKKGLDIAMIRPGQPITPETARFDTEELATTWLAAPKGRKDQAVIDYIRNNYKNVPDAN